MKQYKQKEEDRGDGDRNDDHEVVQGALHIVELTAPLDVVALGQMHFGADALLQLLHITAEVATLYVDSDHDPAFSVDECGTFNDLDAGEFLQRDARTIGGADLKFAHILDAIAEGVGETYDG